MFSLWCIDWTGSLYVNQILCISVLRVASGPRVKLGGCKSVLNPRWIVSPYIIIVQVIFYFLWDHWAHPGYFENRIPLKPALGDVCTFANYSVAYEETQSNRVSDFRDFVCSLFPKAFLFVWSLFPNAVLFYFYLILLAVLRWWSRC